MEETITIGRIGYGPCDELMQICAAEIGISLESVDKSAYRDDLLAMLERVATGKIQQATEASRRAQAARLRQMNASQANQFNAASGFS